VVRRQRRTLRTRISQRNVAFDERQFLS